MRNERKIALQEQTQRKNNYRIERQHAQWEKLRCKTKRNIRITTE